MADVEGLKDSSEQYEDASCDRVKDSSTDESHQEPSADAELDDILEEALKDFERQDLVRQPCSTASASSVAVEETPSVSRSAATSGEEGAACSQSNSATVGSSDVKDMENLIMSLMSGDTSVLTQQLGGLDLDTGGGDAASGDEEFADTLQRTLGDLARSTQDIQSDDLSEEELIRLMSALGSDGIDGGSDDTADADMIPMMQVMMKSLLSKDVLYPSLKDISTKYPVWLQSHRDQISQEEYTRYERQHQLMMSIVQEFDAEQSTDSEDIKRQRFERVLDIMQQMQSLGHPPKELIGDLPKGVELDEDGLPTVPAGLPSSPEQCHVM